MPHIFRVGAFLVYFWANEGKPLEPIHVHVSEGIPSENATKVWLTKTGKCLLCNNNSKVPQKTLKNIMEIIEARNQDVIKKWFDFFGEIHYYC